MDNADTLLFTAFGGEVRRISRFIDKDNKSWSSFNPSIAYSPSEGLAMLVRSSNYLYSKNGSMIINEGSTVKNRMYFCKIFDDLTIGEFIPINFFGFDFPITRGVEDGKLYWRDGGWQFTGIVKEAYGVPFPRVATFKLDGSNAELICIHDEPWMGKTAEKNWMASYEENANFDYVYSPFSLYKDGKVSQTREVPSRYKDLRGTSNLWELGDGTYLAMLHRTDYTKISYYDPNKFGIVFSTLRDYKHMFAQYDNSGKLIKISKNFYFLKPGIEFASGLVVKNKSVIISFGRSDMSSYFATIDLDKVLDLLEEV